MQSQPIERPRKLRPDRDGLLVLSGYGLRLQVHLRHLVVEDGVGRDRRRGSLHRATSRLKRLVVLGHSGLVTLEALRWLHDIGAAFVQIDHDGEVIACFAPLAVNDSPLRYAQAAAAASGQGLAIARDLIGRKVRAQVALLDNRGLAASSIRAPLAVALDGALAARSPEELMWYEASAASIYRNALAPLAVRFVKSELRRIPGHWLVVGPRHSPLTEQPKKAISPAQAMLNFLYAILQAETRVALLARGLDPEIGIFHTLRRYRDSLAADVMEPLRPAVDEFVLNMLATRVLSADDFVETREGSCRLAPDFARTLANTAPLWAARLRPLVADVAKRLVRSGSPAPKPSADGPSKFRGALQRRVAGGRLGPPQTIPLARCLECGAPMSRPRYDRCSACDGQRQALRAPQLGGTTVLARMRAAGSDPAHGGTARTRRSAAASRRHAEAMATTGRERVTTEERQRFRVDVFPKLTNVSVATLSRVTSLSKTYCSFIKRGLRVPHRRHWQALREAAERSKTSSGEALSSSKPAG